MKIGAFLWKFSGIPVDFFEKPRDFKFQNLSKIYVNIISLFSLVFKYVEHNVIILKMYSHED